MTRRRLRINEAAFERQVTDALDVFGWRWQHQRPGRLKDNQWRTAVSGHVGFPDLVAVRGTRLLFAELKGDGGRLTPDQAAWIAALRSTQTTEVCVWWPEHAGAVEDTLRRTDRPHPDSQQETSSDETSPWSVRPKAVDYRAKEAEARARAAEVECRQAINERDLALAVVDELRGEIERLSEKLAAER
ncbi:MAG: VRR-NUC domain-containing protein [Mycobacterium sp.]|nr:VRR-NUC domain-containing protein [Mycobacterium sp.]